MSAPEAKLLLMIASSELSAAEIKAFFKSVERSGANEFVRRIESARRSVEAHQVSSYNAKSSTDEDRLSEYDSVISQIEGLLISGAGLSKNQASKLLYTEIVQNRPGRDYITSPNKIAFRLWLARVLDQVAPSEVMHIASRIRNDIVHGRRSVSDWPLVNR